jgi:hypothetical protein
MNKIIYQHLVLKYFIIYQLRLNNFINLNQRRIFIQI